MLTWPLCALALRAPRRTPRRTPPGPSSQLPPQGPSRRGPLRRTARALLQCSQRVGSAFATLLGTLLYPPHCALCRRSNRPGDALCTLCLQRVEWLDAPPPPCTASIPSPIPDVLKCFQCSRRFPGTPSPSDTLPHAAPRCEDCRARPLAFHCAITACAARGIVRALIHQLKYERKPHLARPLAHWMHAAMADPRLPFPLHDSPPLHLVPVPLVPSKERRRGYNQARLLAHYLHKLTGLPLTEALQKIRDTPSQTQLSRKERLANLQHAFIPHPKAQLKDLHVLLIDDVLTTGTTLDACARVLLGAGAASVHALTLARG